MAKEQRALYQGTFNWRGQVMEEWVRAASPAQAFRLLCARLGTKLNTTAYTVRQYFSYVTGRYEIKEVSE